MSVAPEKKPTFHERVANIQRTLVAPKGQYNSFGKYKYRNCEDILEAVKPLLDGLVLTINDDIVEVGNRIYIKAIAKITDGQKEIANVAMAREPEIRKGMDVAQVTGASSSYARKYALNGLFCIDDNKDPDTQPPPKQEKPQGQNFDKRFKLIEEIKSFSGKINQGKNASEKIKFMVDVLEVKNFDDLAKKPEATLNNILANLKDMA